MGKPAHLMTTFIGVSATSHFIAINRPLKALTLYINIIKKARVFLIFLNLIYAIFLCLKITVTTVFFLIQIKIKEGQLRPSFILF